MKTSIQVKVHEIPLKSFNMALSYTSHLSFLPLLKTCNPQSQQVVTSTGKAGVQHTHWNKVQMQAHVGICHVAEVWLSSFAQESFAVFGSRSLAELSGSFFRLQT